MQTNYGTGPNSRKALGFFFYSVAFGGAERRYLRLAEHLAMLGHPVYVFANEATRALAIQHQIPTKNLTFVIYAKDFSRFMNPFFGELSRKFLAVPRWLKAIFLIQRYELENLHIVSNPSILILFFRVLRNLLPRTTFSIFGLSPQPNSPYQIWFESTLLNQCARLGSAIDCLVPSYQDGALSIVRRIDRHKLRVAPCSFSEYDSVVENERDIPVLFLARFAAGKGISFLKGLEERFSRDGIDFHVVGFGVGILREDFRVSYQTSSPYEILGRAKVFLSIQEHENYPSQSLLEAMASGCAIVATDVGSTRKLLDNSNALLVEPQVEEIYKATLRLLSSEADRKTLGEAARNRVLSHHTIDEYARYFLKDVVGL